MLDDMRFAFLLALTHAVACGVTLTAVWGSTVSRLLDKVLKVPEHMLNTYSKVRRASHAYYLTTIVSTS